MSAGADDVPPRVLLRPIGSPLTLGTSGLGIASLVQSGYDLHWIATTQSPKVGLILIAVPFVLQGIACVLAYLARDGAAGAALGVLSTSWLAIGLVEVTSRPGQRSGAIGLLLLGAAGIIALSAVAISTTKPLPAALFSVAALRFALAGVYQLGGTGAWRQIAGITGLVVVAGAAYCALAFEFEGQQHRPVLPTFRRGKGRAAVLGTPTAAVGDLAHEPGVRQTT